MFAVTVISTKGGVGKSTTCAHLGALLADSGLRVLMLDLEFSPRFLVIISSPTKHPVGFMSSSRLTKHILTT